VWQQRCALIANLQYTRLRCEIAARNALDFDAALVSGKIYPHRTEPEDFP
jgi:hypothetical protein